MKIQIDKTLVKPPVNFDSCDKSKIEWVLLPGTTDVVSDNLFMSYDYSQFSLMEVNRDIDAKMVKNAEDMLERENKSALFPALVDQNLEIADGQTRYRASISKGIPFVFKLCRPQTLEEIARFNNAGKKWTLKTYINTYAGRGDWNYKVLNQIMKSYGLGCYAYIAFKLHANRLTGKGKSVVREGGMLIEYRKETVKLLDLAEELTSYMPEGKESATKKGKFLTVLDRLLMHDKITPDRIIKAFDADALRKTEKVDHRVASRFPRDGGVQDYSRLFVEVLQTVTRRPIKLPNYPEQP